MNVNGWWLDDGTRGAQSAHRPGSPLSFIGFAGNVKSTVQCEMALWLGFVVGPSMRSLLTSVIVLASLAARSDAQVPMAAAAAAEIDQLVARLQPYGDRSAAWSATARLQKRGAPAVAALIEALRRDRFRDDHGNHSPIMEALEKIGPTAARALDAALMPETLKSTSEEHLNLVTRAVAVLSRIGVDDGAAATLVRTVRDSPDDGIRAAAARALLGEWPPRNRLIWIDDVCLGRQLSACPIDAAAPRVAAAVAPFLGELRGLLVREPAPPARLAIAAVLVRWGNATVRPAGEQALMALVLKGEPWIAQQGIDFLGDLGVDAARGAIRARAATAGETGATLRRSAAAALDRLQDPAYIPLVASLFTSEDVFARQWSMASARRSQSVAIVPALIERIGDRSQDGRTHAVTGSDGRTSVVRVTTSDDALAALRALTFEDFGHDQNAWRVWWSATRSKPWTEHLTRFTDAAMAQIIGAEPWMLNAWMTQLEQVRDPSVMPFLAAYLRHPRMEPGAIGPNRSQMGGGPPAILRVLTRLTSQGSREARQLLYECLNSERSPFVIECPKHVAAFDPSRARERLFELMAPPAEQVSRRRYQSLESIEVIRYQAAETLVRLGDVRGIPVLIEAFGAERGTWASSANRTLRSYTQEDIDLASDATPDTRLAAYEAWRRWWQDNGDRFEVNVGAARIDEDCCRM
jgi:hypothetical protein